MTTADLIARLPLMREMFPQPIVMEWDIKEFLRSAQQRAATWKGLNAWRQSAGKIGNSFQFDDFDDSIS